MKLDKIRFAKLVGYIQRQFAISFSTNELNDLDEIIDVEIPEVSNVFPNPDGINTLMALMQEGTKKIDAIRQYRMMTGYGLKESKDIVEKYWPDSTPKLSKNDLLLRLNTYDVNDSERKDIEAFINWA